MLRKRGHLLLIASVRNARKKSNRAHYWEDLWAAIIALPWGVGINRAAQEAAMIRKFKIQLFAGALLAALIGPTGANAASSGYHLLKTFKLGGDGGWDYLNLDPDSGNLFITRGTHVMVVNPDSGKVVADITDTPGVHGTLFLNGQAYISEGGANKLLVVDPKTFKKLSEISVGAKPDGVLYDPVSKHIFTFNGGSKDATAVDPVTGRAMGTITLGGKPEAAVSDGAGTIFVNIETKSEVIAFDSTALKIKAHYPLAPCESPSGMTADMAHGRIFSGCDNAMVAVTDMKTGKVVAHFPIGDEVDANRFDADTGLIFASNGESGTLTVAKAVGSKYAVLDNVPTMKGARTMELDPKTHRVFVVAAPKLKPGTPTVWQPHPRPFAAEGSFSLLVLGR